MAERRSWKGGEGTYHPAQHFLVVDLFDVAAVAWQGRQLAHVGRHGRGPATHTHTHNIKRVGETGRCRADPTGFELSSQRPRPPQFALPPHALSALCSQSGLARNGRTPRHR